MNLKKIYVCVCIWRTSINYFEKKTVMAWCNYRVDGMQLGRGLG